MLASWTSVESELGETLLLVDSATDLDVVARDRVVICGSHAGRYPAELVAVAGVRAVVLNDAGIGLHRAGVAGLGLLHELGVPAVAVGHGTARIGDAADMLERGMLSEINGQAVVLGCAVGMATREAVQRLAAAPRVAPGPLEPSAESRHLLKLGPPQIWALDSASLVRPEDAGAILMIGSHGGLVGGERSRALRVDAAAAVFNDAGGGCDDAGLARIEALAVRNIPAAVVAASSAEIGDGRSTYFDGVLSAVNSVAAALGAAEGMTAWRFATIIGEAVGGRRGDRG
jgi:hypothetical protein